MYHENVIEGQSDLYIYLGLDYINYAILLHFRIL